MDTSLAQLRQAAANASPMEITRSAQLTEGDTETGRPSCRLLIAMVHPSELRQLWEKYPDRDSDTDTGRQQMVEYVRALGALAIRGWEGMTRENIEINSQWALKHPAAFDALPAGTPEKPFEIPYDAAGRDFLMEILDYQTVVKSLEIHCTNTAAFALEVQRARKK